MAVLKLLVEKFHGNAENYYSNFCGLLQENLQPNEFGGDITLTNVLLSEVSNHILMPLSTKKIYHDDQTTKQTFWKWIERFTIKYLLCCSQITFQVWIFQKKDCVYSKQCLSVFLCCKIDSDDIRH